MNRPAPLAPARRPLADYEAWMRMVRLARANRCADYGREPSPGHRPAAATLAAAESAAPARPDVPAPGVRP